MRRAAHALLEYALGFLALAVFAALAFNGGTPTDERMISAFKIGAAIAACEMAVLFGRCAREPSHRGRQPVAPR